MNERAGELLLLALLLILPVAALVARRPPPGRMLLYILGWGAIFGLGLLLVGQRERLGIFRTAHAIEGRETRIDMAPDGHFWANVTIDGVHRRMLIDSGASSSAISQATAREAGLESDSPFPIVLDTVNGRITAQTATAKRVEIGGVVARDLQLVVSPTFGNTEVIGMSFLSRLSSWEVRERTLVLTPGSRH